jgi:hypothetical protein
MGKDKIEHGETSLYVLPFMFPAVAEVFTSEVPVELAGENVMDHSVFGKAFGPGVFVSLEFHPELRGAFVPRRSGEREELPGHEVPGMRGHTIEEVSFLRRVPEGLERFDMGGGDAHRARILAVSSCSSRMRRSRETSSGRL